MREEDIKCRTEGRYVPRASKLNHGEKKWAGQTCYKVCPTLGWSVPLLQFPDITPPQLQLPLWCASTWEIHLSFHVVVVFSLSDALGPAMLPWELAGESKHPLYLFPFIPFLKWIKHFLFGLAWKMCPNLSPKICTFEMLNLTLGIKKYVVANRVKF